jgi:hypothetical protein
MLNLLPIFTHKTFFKQNLLEYSVAIILQQFTLLSLLHIGGSCEYIESAVLDSQFGGLPAWGLGWGVHLNRLVSYKMCYIWPQA